MTTAQLDVLFPQRHEVAESLGIGAVLRASFAPIVARPTTAQQQALFPNGQLLSIAITPLLQQQRKGA